MSEDSLEPLVTQCPNCDTRFRVTEAQLQIAHGRVRCGACLAVFDGADHLSLEDDDFKMGEDSGDFDALLEELDHIPSEAAPPPDLTGRDLSPVSQSSLVDDSDADEGLPEELLALEEALLNEMRQGTGTTTAAPVVEGSKTPEPELTQAVEPAPAAEPETTLDLPKASLHTEDTVHTKETIETEESLGPEDTLLPEDEWLDDVAEDAWHDKDQAQASIDNAATGGTVKETDDLELQTEGAPDEEVIELSALADSPPAEPATPIKLSAYSGEVDDAFAEEPSTRPKRSWLTYTLLLLGVIGLPAQVLWYQYDTWVKDPQYRPVYQTICDVFACELPPLRDLTKIVAKKSFIRAHPERADARVVDVLMVNEADFAQPFPLIELIATSMRGQLVAGRRFKPAEYLQGDMVNAELFPPLTPIHVSLEIQDPGEDALNFEVKFR
jgi:predicted Zn finger-like uncharacterized protein